LPRMIWRDAPEVTTEDDEVEISASVIAPQRVTHRKKTRTLENQRGAAPASATYNGSYANDILRPRLVSERISEYILCATRAI